MSTMNISFEEMTVLLRGGNCVESTIDFIVEMVAPDTLPDFCHEIIIHLLVSTMNNLRLNAAKLLGALVRRYKSLFISLISTSAYDGVLVELSSLKFDKVSASYSGWLLSGSSGDISGRSSNDAYVYDKEWLKSQRSFMINLIGMEELTAESTVDSFQESEGKAEGNSALKYSELAECIQDNDFLCPGNGSVGVETSGEVISAISSERTKRTNEVWFVRLMRCMTVGLVNRNWEKRHGYACGLCAVLDGMQTLRSESLFLSDDIITCGLLALFLDRFLDFGEDGLMCRSPVKESIGRLISFALLTDRNYDRLELVWTFLCHMIADENWTVCMGALIGLKYIVSKYVAFFLEEGRDEKLFYLLRSRMSFDFEGNLGELTTSVVNVLCSLRDAIVCNYQHGDAAIWKSSLSSQCDICSTLCACDWYRLESDHNLVTIPSVVASLGHMADLLSVLLCRLVDQSSCSSTRPSAPRLAAGPTSPSNGSDATTDCVLQAVAACNDILGAGAYVIGRLELFNSCVERPQQEVYSSMMLILNSVHAVRDVAVSRLTLLRAGVDSDLSSRMEMILLRNLEQEGALLGRMLQVSVSKPAGIIDPSAHIFDGSECQSRAAGDTTPRAAGLSPGTSITDHAVQCSEHFLQRQEWLGKLACYTQACLQSALSMSFSEGGTSPHTSLLLHLRGMVSFLVLESGVVGFGCVPATTESIPRSVYGLLQSFQATLISDTRSAITLPLPANALQPQENIMGKFTSPQSRLWLAEYMNSLIWSIFRTCSGRESSLSVQSICTPTAINGLLCLVKEAAGALELALCRLCSTPKQTCDQPRQRPQSGTTGRAGKRFRFRVVSENKAALPIRAHEPSALLLSKQLAQLQMMLLLAHVLMHSSLRVVFSLTIDDDDAVKAAFFAIYKRLVVFLNGLQPELNSVLVAQPEILRVCSNGILAFLSSAPVSFQFVGSSLDDDKVAILLDYFVNGMSPSPQGEEQESAMLCMYLAARVAELHLSWRPRAKSAGEGCTESSLSAPHAYWISDLRRILTNALK